MSRLEAVFNDLGSQEFYRVLTRSTVGLGYTAKRLGSAERVYQYASGFLLSIQDTWFFITAGHVLSKMEEVKEAGYLLGEWHLDDTTGWEDKNRRVPPPFTFANEDTIVLETAEGNDYAAIRIKPFHRKELEANGKVALTESQWRPDWKLDALPDIKAFCIVGVPDERIESVPTAEVFTVNKDLAFCEVEPLDSSEVADQYQRSIFCFYGRIADDLYDDEKNTGVESIKGMSGGPIYALHKTEEGVMSATVIAVQSAWRPKARIVIGCLIRPFAEHLLEQLQAEVAVNAAQEPRQDDAGIAE